MKISILFTLLLAVESRNRKEDMINELRQKYIPTNDYKGLEQDPIYSELTQESRKKTGFRTSFCFKLIGILIRNKAKIVFSLENSSVEVDFNLVRCHRNKMSENDLTEVKNRADKLICNITRFIELNLIMGVSPPPMGISQLFSLNTCILSESPFTLLVEDKIAVTFKNEFGFFSPFKDVTKLFPILINSININKCYSILKPFYTIF